MKATVHNDKNGIITKVDDCEISDSINALSQENPSHNRWLKMALTLLAKNW
jgi:hypothetical protein